jgi:clan AA aspartic protease (TIGR02281 family)
MAARPAWSDGEMVLDREGDGHFYATVSVDASNYRMLVDTGASMVALTGEDAQNMGLDWDPNALAPVARGVGGTVMGVPAREATVKLRRGSGRTWAVRPASLPKRARRRSARARRAGRLPGRRASR